jgi:hypothetical protein
MDLTQVMLLANLTASGVKVAAHVAPKTRRKVLDHHLKILIVSS